MITTFQNHRTKLIASIICLFICISVSGQIINSSTSKIKASNAIVPKFQDKKCFNTKNISGISKVGKTKVVPISLPPYSEIEVIIRKTGGKAKTKIGYNYGGGRDSHATVEFPKGNSKPTKTIRFSSGPNNKVYLRIDNKSTTNNFEYTAEIKYNGKVSAFSNKRLTHPSIYTIIKTAVNSCAEYQKVYILGDTNASADFEYIIYKRNNAGLKMVAAQGSYLQDKKPGRRDISFRVKTNNPLEIRLRKKSGTSSFQYRLTASHNVKVY